MSFSSKITLGSSPFLTVTDTTVYGDPSIVKGIVNIEGPDGWLRNGTNADIADYTTSTTSINIPLPIDQDGNPLSGDYKVTLVTEGVVDTQTVSYNYRHLDVSPSISFDANIAAGFVSVKETTGYGAYLQSEVRELRVEYPQGIEPEIADLVTTAAELIISPLYSGTYTVTLTSTYQLLTDGLNIEGSFSQAFERVVVYDKRLCEAASCIKKVQNAYEDARSNNPLKVISLSQKIISMLVAYMNYTISVNCGKPDQSLINDIIAEAKSCGCSCSDCGDDLEGPQLISPLIPGISNSNEIHTLAGVPSDSFGENGDVYINTNNGDLYKKENDAWGTPKLNLKGTDGDDGDDGTGNYTYVAYCSTVWSGPYTVSGFSLTPTASTKYVSVRTSTTPLTATDEAIYENLWIQYAQKQFTYIIYCRSFDGSGVPVGVSQSPDAFTRYFSKLETDTEITTFDTANIALFLGNWVQYAPIASTYNMSVSIGNSGNTTLDSNNSVHYDMGQIVFSQIDITLTMSANSTSITLILGHFNAGFKAGLLFITNESVFVKVYQDGSGGLQLIRDDSSNFVNGQTYQIRGQLFIPKTA